MHGIHTAVKDESVEILSKPLAPPSPSINPSASLSPHNIEKGSPLVRRQLDINYKELETLRNVIHLLDTRLEMVKSQEPVEGIPCLNQEESSCTSPLMLQLKLFGKIVRELTTQLELTISKIEL